MARFPVLKIGSLDSALARSQTQAVLDRISTSIPQCQVSLELVPSPVADQDKNEENFLAVSAKEMEHLAELVRVEACDAFVTTAADMALPLADGLQIVCVPDRKTPFDALLNRQGQIMDEMEPAGRVGVLSLRAKTQMESLWPDLDFRIIRGGVDRAMAIHLRKSEIAGLVLPAAVTEHLGIQGIVTEIFSPDFLLPGPGQGTLVVIGRASDNNLKRILQPMHSRASATELSAEQAFQMRLISDQDLPVGVLARVNGREISVVGATGAGSSRIRGDGYVDEAEMVGQNLADHVLQSVDSFLELLEADFPDGLPEDDLPDPDEPMEEDYDELADFADEDILDLDVDDQSDDERP